jgi:DNA-3-methyladenine glycosylase
MYWLLNVACEPVENPAAVLIRALEPLDGQEFMAVHRHPYPQRHWTSGPGRLTRALKIDGTFNLIDLTTPQKNGLWFEKGDPIAEAEVQTGARIGLGKRIPSEWRDAPLRWWVRNHPHVSK